MRELRLDRKDKSKIIQYAKDKGITGDQTLLELKKYIEKILDLKDAHNFSFSAFLGIIKILILSQIERSYLNSIEKELVRS
jgi:hypothetical protein